MFRAHVCFIKKSHISKNRHGSSGCKCAKRDLIVQQFFQCWGEMMGGLGQENETQLAETRNMVFTSPYTAPDVGA
jgi:hypothetical protein